LILKKENESNYTLKEGEKIMRAVVTYLSFVPS
jgi:hypothetical protein